MGFCAVLACASLQTPVMAKVTLPAFFTSNMIIQQKTTMTLFGKAKANKKVSVETSWNNQHYEAQADAKGNWRIEIATPAAGALTASPCPTVKRPYWTMLWRAKSGSVPDNPTWKCL